jgi:hypothetical protein
VHQRANHALETVSLYESDLISPSSLTAAPLPADVDTREMEAFGYTQELNRGLHSWTNFAFGFTELSVYT